MHVLRTVFLFCALPAAVLAQDDLLDELEKQADGKPQPVSATFKSTRIINVQSVETMKRNHLDFRISHRFGRLNSGAKEFFGLDQAVMRLGFEYGITDDLMVGVGRSGEQKAYDFFGKYKLLKQTTGAAQSMPISVTLFGSAVIRTQESFVPGETYSFQDKLTYTGQLLIARKFSERLSLQLTPTYLYRNRPELSNDENLLLAMGVGGRLKVSRRVSINADYFYAFRENNNLPYYNSLALGVDIETGGHVFSLHFTNSLGMIEKQFIGETTGSWGKGDIHYGFNISRTFSLDRKKKLLPN
ncbi:DUF5777 family beta-barrel protein [Arundinibacter roseus]|uniref:DUF5777 domain-containing protein n=1 Tax=Arundinibacter roseus TaxID=2070510 RepID=A0A4R4KBX2_9BACT|nr:DUF5777 family beta-barrel protein [Arundinibacter roseus]TDB63719.1 hypothetical protein EZE20_15590 [Arundinibacter roseus]